MKCIYNNEILNKCKNYEFNSKVLEARNRHAYRIWSKTAQDLFLQLRIFYAKFQRTTESKYEDSWYKIYFK